MSTKTLAAIGDSQTDKAPGYGVGAYDIWPAVLARLLGTTWQARNYGIAGDTTASMLARADVTFMHETPDLFILAGGVNDPGATVSTAATTQNAQAMLLAAKHGVSGRRAGVGGGISVATQTALPDAQTARIGTRMVVLQDTSTTGGVAAAAAGQAATVTGTVAADANGNQLAVWECRYPLAGEYGWSRVAKSTTAPTFVQHSLVIPPPYRNWTTGGDTPTTPYAQNATLRTALQAAVTAENVPVAGAATVLYSDLYAFMLARITGGTDPDFTTVTYDQTRSWHYVSGNQHYSAYGHALQAVKANTDIRAAWPALVS